MAQQAIKGNYFLPDDLCMIPQAGENYFNITLCADVNEKNDNTRIRKLVDDCVKTQSLCANVVGNDVLKATQFVEPFLYRFGTSRVYNTAAGNAQAQALNDQTDFSKKLKDMVDNAKAKAGGGGGAQRKPQSAAAKKKSAAAKKKGSSSSKKNSGYITVRVGMPRKTKAKKYHYYYPKYSGYYTVLTKNYFRPHNIFRAKHESCRGKIIGTKPLSLNRVRRMRLQTVNKFLRCNRI